MKRGEPTCAVGYVRVSTDEQVQGFSLEGQAERIRSYSESQDYLLERIYRDDGLAKGLDAQVCGDHDLRGQSGPPGRHARAR